MRGLLTAGFVAALVAGALAQAPAGAPQGRGPQGPPAVPTVVKVGDMAPDFTLQGTDGKTHKLSDYRGKQAVVLAWFPKAFTQGCTIECKSLAENGDKIQKYQVAYFMASVDPLDDNIKFAKATSVTLQGRNGGPATVVEKKEADFPMLSDPTKETAKAYGVLNEQAGFANRWTFYIDKTGKVSAIDTAVKPATSAEDMLAKMDELKIAMK
jgi:peroxiredoxin Q/BCP